MGSEWNKRAVNRVGVRMKNENKRWPTSPGEGEGEYSVRGKDVRGGKMERVRDRQRREEGEGGGRRREWFGERLGAENGIGAYCSVTLAIWENADIL